MWKKYDDEFKRNALQKVFNGQSVRSVAEQLGVNESLIHTAVGNARQNHYRRHYLHSAARRQVLLSGGVAGSVDAPDYRLEFSSGDDRHPCDFSFGKSRPQRKSSSRSDYSLGSG